MVASYEKYDRLSDEQDLQLEEEKNLPTKLEYRQSLLDRKRKPAGWLEVECENMHPSHACMRFFLSDRVNFTIDLTGPGQLRTTIEEWKKKIERNNFCSVADKDIFFKRDQGGTSFVVAGIKIRSGGDINWIGKQEVSSVTESFLYKK